ncbi:MAG TPA: ribbon-helix-helix domain-containing protein [Candidatus Thermoplasmatota archaeon]|nr:ribbon-helix-helix domain-containing protein [Candidatus Thermoplasmatota archaeon]
MARNTVRRTYSIPIDLDRAFRIAVVKETGMIKGDMSRFVADAIRDWVRKRGHQAPR